jgi:alanine dehydrogenase
VGLLFLDAHLLASLLDYPQLVDALKVAFTSGGIIAPQRTVHTMHVDRSGADTLLMMPAWNNAGALGVKLVTVHGSTRDNSGSTVNAIYVLFDPKTGAPVACLDGETLTRRRTAAVSALAASLLARRDAVSLLMVGTGALAVDMVRAHCAVRPISQVSIWGRNFDTMQRKAESLRKLGIAAQATSDLRGAVDAADIVCCATTAREPLIMGEWLRPGQHLDLTGAFRPDMREADDEAIRRGELFVDTLDGALAEAGEIVQAIAGGSIERTHVRATLTELCQSAHPGRSGSDSITVFKSVGTATADLAAGTLALRSWQASSAKEEQ